jgi:post-segregation antitoxin (ccd killing protein)
VPLYVQQKQIVAKRAAELNMTHLSSNDLQQELKKSKLI